MFSALQKRRRRGGGGSGSGATSRMGVILVIGGAILIVATILDLFDQHNQLLQSSSSGGGAGVGFAEPAIIALNLMLTTTTTSSGSASSAAAATSGRRMRVGEGAKYPDAKKEAVAATPAIKDEKQQKQVLNSFSLTTTKQKNRDGDDDEKATSPSNPRKEKRKKPELIKSFAIDDGSISPKDERRKYTDTGIRVDDPELFTGKDLHGDSSTATVMGMATGYGIDVYKKFVGSLRRTGYKGHIILGVGPDDDVASPEVVQYFNFRNVTAKKMAWVNCTYRNPSKDNDIFKQTTCAHPYPDIKIRWSRFPLARDWLKECKTCTGPVLIMDVRDSFFQLDPFGPGSPTIRGLQVYQEHASQTTQHWLTKWPIGTCKGIEFNETMLCSGTTTGTRTAMLKYLDIMYEEMKVWITDVEQCHFDINGDDQSIHNYLYYTGQLPFATSIPNRNGGGVVNTVGVEAVRIWKQHKQSMMLNGFPEAEAGRQPYEGSDGKMRWIGGVHSNLIDDEGYILETDGSRSRVVHQWDRFGVPFMSNWLSKQDFVHDGDDIFSSRSE